MKYLLLIALVAGAGCDSKLDRQATLELYTHASRGVIAGIDHGDALEDVKLHPPPGFEAGKDLLTDRGELYGHMLYLASGSMKHNIQLRVDRNKKVTGIETTITGGDHDAVVAGLFDDLSAFYEQKLGKPHGVDPTDVIFFAPHERTVEVRLALLDGLTTLTVTSGTALGFHERED